MLASVCIACMSCFQDKQIIYVHIFVLLSWAEYTLSLGSSPLLLSVCLIHGTDSNAACEHHSDATHPRFCRME
jgi:hypothetical protein